MYLRFGVVKKREVKVGLLKAVGMGKRDGV
jgi:hypothetical protein